MRVNRADVEDGFCPAVGGDRLSLQPVAELLQQRNGTGRSILSVRDAGAGPSGLEALFSPRVHRYGRRVTARRRWWTPLHFFVSVINVIVVLVWLLRLLNEQFHGRISESTGYVLAGAFFLWWLLAGPLRNGMSRGGGTVRAERFGRAIDTLAWVGRGALVAVAIVHYASVRPDELRVDPTLAWIGAALIVTHLMRLTGRWLAGDGVTWDFLRGHRVIWTALRWAGYIGTAAAARFLGAWAAYAVFWVPDTVIAWASGWLPDWLAVGVVWLLWAIPLGFATGVLQYRTVRVQRLFRGHDYGGHTQEWYDDVELSRRPRYTGTRPIADLDYGITFTNTSWSGGWSGASGQYSGVTDFTRRLLQLQFPPAYVPIWLHWMR